jgi:NAD(P)-dependent dehydrogenase (short-subunit alcohol dehydrogenase family)
MSKVVIITGCSTGIGRDLAQRLSKAGYQVVATARQLDSMNDIPAELKIPLDVTREDSVKEAVTLVLQKFGRIDVLVNNAGYGLRGAVEEIPIESVKRVFDVNVFGVIRMIQAVLPQMRKQGCGRIINISSIAGKLPTPVNGIYSATKFGLEALSDSLRVELAPFGIQVVIVEPGPIKTRFDETAQSAGVKDKAGSASPYLPLYQKNDEIAATMRKNEPGPEAVSQVIQEAIEASKPKARYLAGVAFSGRLAINFRDFFWNPLVERMFKI